MSLNNPRLSSSFGNFFVPRLVNSSLALDLCCFHSEAWMQRLPFNLANPCVCQDGALGLGEFLLRFPTTLLGNAFLENAQQRCVQQQRFVTLVRDHAPLKFSTMSPFHVVHVWVMMDSLEQTKHEQVMFVYVWKQVFSTYHVWCTCHVRCTTFALGAGVTPGVHLFQSCATGFVPLGA